MLMAGLEPATSASERLQTHALDRAVTWTGKRYKLCSRNYKEEAAFLLISLSFVFFSDDVPVDCRTAETCSMIK